MYRNGVKEFGDEMGGRMSIFLYRIYLMTRNGLIGRRCGGVLMFRSDRCIRSGNRRLGLNRG